MIYGYLPLTDHYLAHFRRAEGQVRGLQCMVSEGEYRIDILTQMSVVQSTLRAVTLEFLEDHMDHCVISATRESDEAGHEKIQETTHAVIELMES